MSNQVFEDNYSELAEILRKIADEVDGTSNTGRTILDSKGAKVGQWEITPFSHFSYEKES